MVFAFRVDSSDIEEIHPTAGQLAVQLCSRWHSYPPAHQTGAKHAGTKSRHDLQLCLAGGQHSESDQHALPRQPGMIFCFS